MTKLFELGNQYAKESDWKDFALIKVCLCAMGIAIGAQVSQRHRKVVTSVAAGVFITTYIPLMTKLLKISLRKNEE